jgi:hypothetical protein
MFRAAPVYEIYSFYYFSSVNERLALGFLRFLYRRSSDAKGAFLLFSCSSRLLYREILFDTFELFASAVHRREE